jgi:hypothetical protein
MKKISAVLLVLAAAGILAWMTWSPAPQPAWQPNAQLTFLGYTNTTRGAPATNALFGLKGLRVGPYSWEVLEIARQQDGKWKRWEPPPVRFPKLHYGGQFGSFLMLVSVPVPITNAPLRVVMEIGENGPMRNEPPKGEMTKFYEKWRYRAKRRLHPDNPARWLPPVPRFRMTNEFNFPTSTKAR